MNKYPDINNVIKVFQIIGIILLFPVAVWFSIELKKDPELVSLIPLFAYSCILLDFINKKTKKRTDKKNADLIEKYNQKIAEIENQKSSENIKE